MEVETETEIDSLTTSLEQTTSGDENINRTSSHQSQEQAEDSPTSSQVLFTQTQPAQLNAHPKSTLLQPTPASKHPTTTLEPPAAAPKRTTPQQPSSRVTKPLPTKRTTPRTAANLPAFMQVLLTAKTRPAPTPAAKPAAAKPTAAKPLTAKPAAKSNKVKDHAFVWGEEEEQTPPSSTPAK